MNARTLVIFIILMTPLIFQQGFSQCIYNDDWPDAPCFDTGPVSHLEFNKAWAPYYDYKGAEWMEAKRVEMIQSLQAETLEDWVEEIENYNVYRYYLSRNEIQSSLPYDGFFVVIDPNFRTPDSGPKHNIVNEMNLEKAMINLRQSFQDNVSFGPFDMKDAVVGYGIQNDSIIVDVKTEYYESEYLGIVEENIQGIVGDVYVEFNSADELTNEQICGPEAELVDGVCIIIVSESPHHVNTSPFYQSLMLVGIFLWPFFISGSAIFIVLAKTPRFKKSTRISVTLVGSMVIVWFLAMLFIGVWPQLGD